MGYHSKFIIINMIQSETMLVCADNTGAKKVLCLRLLGGGKKYGRVGDEFIGVVKSATPNLAVKKSEVVRAVVVRSSFSEGREDFSRVRFADNACVLVRKNKLPRGTRVFGPVDRKLRYLGYDKICSLALEVI